MSKKVYLLTDADFELLLTKIDRDPQYGQNGGSSQSLNDNQKEAFRQAHGFYNYQLRTWIDKIKD